MPTPPAGTESKFIGSFQKPSYFLNYPCRECSFFTLHVFRVWLHYFRARRFHGSVAVLTLNEKFSLREIPVASLSSFIPLPKWQHQVKICAFGKVCNVGHSVRAVVTQCLKFGLKFMRTDNHDVRADMEVFT
jgi:hypothetical protein